MNYKPKRDISSEKTVLHPRNPHRFRYDFQQLITACPYLAKFVFVNQFGNESIEFANPDAVKTLNRALLHYFYGVENWDIPANYLCPPIPGRADYIHYVADLLASCNGNQIPRGNLVSVLDIGVGANCVYPIIGSKEYDWRFVGTEIDAVAVKSAQDIIRLNPSLSDKIEIRFQSSPKDIFKDIIQPNEIFDLSICNPPFHASQAEATAATTRKSTNLGLIKSNKPVLNFGGQNKEIWCDGGEEAFLKRMVEQSAQFPKSCFWYTSLVSKKDSLANVYYALKLAKAAEIRTINMAQGQKISRIVAWTFLNETEQNAWKVERWEH